jgi:hypothetical protein
VWVGPSACGPEERLAAPSARWCGGQEHPDDMGNSRAFLNWWLGPFADVYGSSTRRSARSMPSHRARRALSGDPRLLALNGWERPDSVEDAKAKVQGPEDVVIVRLVPVDDAVADVSEADHRVE